MHDQPAPLCRALEQRIACTISLRDLESTPRLGAGKHGAVRKNGVHGQFAVACAGCRKQCGSAWLVLDGQHVSSPRQWPARGKTCARAFLVNNVKQTAYTARVHVHFSMYMYMNYLGRSIFLLLVALQDTYLVTNLISRLGIVIKSV